MKTRWPKIEDIEFMRWTHNHTQYHSFAFGFCEAQGCCEQCVRRVRVLCKIRNWIDGIRGRIIKRHYKTNTW